MMNDGITRLLACCISAVLLIVPGTFGVWITVPTEVELEDPTELSGLMEGCQLRCESRRSVAIRVAGAALRRRPDSAGAGACCRNLRQTGEHCVSGRLPGGKALAPLLV
ncbi:MAG: hypothetical protein DWI22_19990 [Planctomycetota bacterium]|nr:MAG: hypothetical protein DWI22_19990 [Planctomycetota bacterium]